MGNYIRSPAISGKIDEENKKWYEKLESIGKEGFHWRGGAKRELIGTYMWIHRFIFLRSSFSPSMNDEKLTVTLVDSQGMFDYETTMTLTSSIFSWATLLISYQIYNVDKIQEDNLIHLTLFLEYGPMALIGKVNTNIGYADPNNEVHDNAKYVNDRKEKSYVHFELTILINLLFLALRYLDDNKSVDKTVEK